MANIAVIGSTTSGNQTREGNAGVTSGAGNITMVTNDFAVDIFWTMLRSHSVYQAGEFLEQYMPFTLAAIGVPLNAVTLIIMNRIKPLTSGTFIMMLIAIADTLNLLYFSCVGRKMLSTFTSDAHCQAFWTVHSFLQYIAIWLVILLTLERVVAVCFPMKAARICTVANARKAVLILLILDALLNVPNIYVYALIGRGQHKSCEVKPHYTVLRVKMRVVDAAVFVIIPLTMLTLGNISIIVKLRTSRNVANLTEELMSTDKSKQQNASLTYMLLAVSITSIACIGPNVIISLTGDTGWMHARTDNINADALHYFVGNMIVFITYINNAINFFLYVLSGSRFRAVFLQILSTLIGMQLMILHK